MLLSQNNPEQRDSIRTIAIRSELISTAQRHNNDNNERALSKEQPTSDNETKAGAKDKATAKSHVLPFIRSSDVFVSKFRLVFYVMILWDSHGFLLPGVVVLVM